MWSFIVQPKTSVKFDPKTFKRIKKNIRNMSKARRGRIKNARYATAIPKEIDIQLTYRCNLRCKHCYQWNEQGFFNDFDNEKQNMEIDVAIIDKLLKETHEVKSNLFLWGGEPLVHQDWEIITRMLEKDQRWTTMCTNGLLLEKKMDSILRISSNLALLISLDGFQEQHDFVRGEGTFNHLINNIELLLKLQKKGGYRGLISIQCFLSKGMVGKLYDFAEYCENLRVDTVYFAFPWYISKETAKQMDEHFRSNFSWLNPLSNNQKPSWHSYAHHLDLSIMETLREQITKLNSRVWKIRVRLNPPLEVNEFENFFLGKDQTAQNRQCCLAISNRMEIFPDGNVSSCKFFPEFNIGSLYEKGVVELWQSEKFGKIREIINNRLMPICSKCVLLYLNGQ